MAPNCTVDDTSFVSDIFIGKIRSQVIIHMISSYSLSIYHVCNELIITGLA
jgi:hypothetical protein